MKQSWIFVQYYFHTLPVFIVSCLLLSLLYDLFFLHLTQTWFELISFIVCFCASCYLHLPEVGEGWGPYETSLTLPHLLFLSQVRNH